MKVKFILYGIALFLGCSCKDSKHEAKTRVDVESIVEKGKKIRLSEIGSKPYYVPLETNDNCLISSIVETFFWGDEILVVSGLSNPVLYLFSSEGKFLKQIGSSGKGPGEYGSIGCVSLHNSGKNILLKTDLKNKLICIDKNSNYSDGISIGECDGFISFQDNIYAHKASVLFRKNYNDPNQLFVFDLKGTQVNSFHPVKKVKTTYIDMFYEFSQFSKADDQLFYHVDKEYDIYSVKDNSLEVYYQLSMGRYQFSSDYKWDMKGYADSKKSDKMVIKNAIVCDRFILLGVRQKRESSILAIKRENFADGGYLVDDIDNLSLSNLKSIYSNKFITPIDVVRLKSSDKLNNCSTELQRLIKSSKKQDNPILRIIDLNQ